ncbi:1823_t:CDS:2 [Gigaspora margarita]|uniref:1823_t:CDS:1 n=1 Tax=Gigaspora margarita TaxID=4874 RepID=A0ABN7VUK8_GIGMA|nr:1823_t:CDS:2 [Gigaspora margarita]
MGRAIVVRRSEKDNNINWSLDEINWPEVGRNLYIIYKMNQRTEKCHWPKYDFIKDETDTSDDELDPYLKLYKKGKYHGRIIICANDKALRPDCHHFHNGHPDDQKLLNQRIKVYIIKDIAYEIEIKFSNVGFNTKEEVYYALDKSTPSPRFKKQPTNESGKTLKDFLIELGEFEKNAENIPLEINNAPNYIIGVCNIEKVFKSLPDYFINVLSLTVELDSEVVWEISKDNLFDIKNASIRPKN